MGALEAHVRIKKLRALLIVHSYIYYRLGDSLVSDDQWQNWAQELLHIQKEVGHKVDYYDYFFKDWDGATGMHLPQDPWVASKALHLLRIRDEKLEDNNVISDL